ncbi:MAG: tRNA lysidine(34) synthetase TilS [Anaerolineales bacterium]
MLLADVQKMLREICGVDPEQKLVLGFSGGPDSLVLLHVLNSLNQPLVAAHLDHGLRPESAAEAGQAGELAAGFGVPFVTDRVDGAAYAKDQGFSIEEAARELRYRFLYRIASLQNAQAVAVAHSADDQVETVLMHLLRGAGAAGLRGMAPRLLPNPWSQDLPLVRPLLATWRQDILEFCQAKGLQPLHDPSNQDPTYFRNRLRQELVPQMEGLAPGFKKRLAHSAELLAADYAALEDMAEEAWRRWLLARGSDYLHLNRSSFLAEPLAMQRALLRRALAELRPEQRDLDFAGVLRALELIKKKDRSAPEDWLAGLYLLIEGEQLWIAGWEAELPVKWPQAPASAVSFKAPAELALNSGWRLVAGIQQPGRLSAAQNGDEYQAQLDLDQMSEQLVLRRPRPGDRFQPLGMETGSIKLADFFINEKLPRRARAAWPLVCRGEEIVWVPGYRLAHPYRLQANSRQVMRLTLEHD